MVRTALVSVALVAAFVMFLPCACGERAEEPPSATRTPAPTGTVEPTLMAEPTFGSNPLPPFPSPKVPTPEPSPTPGWAERNLDPALVETLKEREVPSEPTAPLTPVWAEPTPEPWIAEAERKYEQEVVEPWVAECLKQYQWKTAIECEEMLPPIALEPPPTPTIDPSSVAWPGLLDGRIDFKVELLMEPVGGRYDLSPWIASTIESGWGISTSYADILYNDAGERFIPDTPPGFQVDLVITFEDELNYDGQEVCAVTSRPTSNSGGICYVTLSRRCWDREFIYEDVPEKTLLHEVGHCMGLGDGGPGVMAIPIQNWTTEEDIRGIYETYGLDY